MSPWIRDQEIRPVGSACFYNSGGGGGGGAAGGVERGQELGKREAHETQE